MRALPPRLEGLPSTGETAEWERFTQQLRDRVGVSLAGYNPTQTRRRVRWLMQRSGARHLGDYLGLLDRQPEKLRELRSSMSVHVSEFFRSPDQFRRLRTDIMPKLLSDRPALRVWSAGCSYGAEPYSLTLLLDQLAPRQPHFVLGTDIDDLALARAAEANHFSERDLQNVPPEFRGWFHGPSITGRFSLDRSIASRVTFARHDLLTDPMPFTLPATSLPFDLILCRNVMMYFTAEAKARLFELLYGALRPDGYLFVGDAEVVNELSAAGFRQDVVGFYQK